MAKFWDVTYHEDTTEKHGITKEEIDFLKKLQKEMNTQDHVGQADPRYWTIRDYEKIYGKDMDNPDGILVYDQEACVTVFEMPYRFFSSSEMANEVLSALEKNDYELSVEDKEQIELSYDFGSLCEALEEMNFIVSEYEEYPIDKGCFLTHDAAIQHLKSNDYHYGENAHTYALTAWRSKEEKLWEILQKVDFDKLKSVES